MRNPSHSRPRIDVVAALVLAGAFGSTGSRAQGAEPLCVTPAEIVRVAAVVDDGDVALEDGRTLRLAGLDLARATPTNPGLGETARAALADRLVGREAAVAILSPAPDRWERLSALVAAPDQRRSAEGMPEGEATSMNERLIEEGWARTRPEVAIRSCATRYLALEIKARAAGLGLWSDPYYAVVRGDDRRGLAERTGAMALVEGTARVRRRRERLYLQLGEDGHGFAATLAPRQVQTFARAGIRLENLVGSRLRIRGFLDDRFGPRIDVTEAGQVEVLSAGDPAADRPAEGVRGGTERSDTEAREPAD